MKAAVILAGCGYLDGAEIRESVLSLLYLDQANVQATCFAADIPQHHTIDHLGQNEAGDARNVLTESARIARSNVTALNELNAEDYDLLVLPGGFGVAKNYSDLAFKGADCTVEPSYKKAVENFYAARKPIVAICIAPAVLAAALKDKGITLTIGDDAGTAGAIEHFGNTHQNAATNEAVIDDAHNVVSCSAYMREDSIADVATGIEKAIQAGIQLAKTNTQAAA